MRSAYVLVITVLVVIAGAGITPIQGQTASETGNQPTASPSQSGCNYTALYNDTIDSTVSVQRAGGQGSGFVYNVSENGTSYIVTNAHVVGNATSVTIRFSRGETRRGQVIGRARSVDLAVVRINQTPSYVEALPVANTVPPTGQYVAALGSPFGLEETMTHGIVSGVNRSLPTVGGFVIPTTVQTDAPISPGNSGGPLVTCNGTVVGVNTAGIGARRAENIGFAIPAPLIQRAVPQLIQTGEFNLAFFGVRTTELTPAIKTANNLTTSQGAYVVSVLEGGPASGVLQGADRTVAVNGTRVPVGGDVIVAVENRSVTSSQDLSEFLVRRAQPGETVSLTVIRNGERRQVNVTLGERPEPGTR